MGLDQDIEMGRMVMEAFGRFDEIQITNGRGLAMKRECLKMEAQMMGKTMQIWMTNFAPLYGV
jgi:hypothetical protein